MKRRLGFLLLFFGVSTLLFALQKPLFMTWHRTLCSGCTAADWWQVVRHGWALDMTVAGYVTALPVLLLIASLWIPLRDRTWQRMLTGYTLVISLAAAAVTAVDFGLYGYWGYRIDNSVLLYLKTPREAAASVTPREWFVQGLLFAGIAAGMAGAYRLVVRTLHFVPVRGWNRLTACLALLLAGGGCFLAIRGGTGPSTANVSKVYYSENQFLNHAAVNPLFSLVSTLGYNKDLRPQYLYFDEAERAERFEALRGDRPDTTLLRPLLNCRRPDVVIVLLESFGRTFTDEVVDGRPVTPRLQEYRERGIWFENFYANSFRTDRGQVAIFNGFPAQTRMSIMKYPAKNRTLPSIARSLGREGYESFFCYGGDLNFTNQASCMYATGWQRLVWQKEMHFDSPTSKWGYDDAATGAFFADEVLRLARREERAPFLAGWLTLSSHEPFDVPFERFGNKVLNAVAFTDDCVGQMLDRLRADEACWEHLLVILIADHGFPYPEGLAYWEPLRHRIPMLWTGGAVAEPGVVEAYGSQIDLAATLLAQMGIGHDDFLYSKNLLDEGLPHFGYWCFNEGFGVADAAGATVWDCTSERLLCEEEPASGRLETGKVLLQTTYKDILER